LPFALLEVNLGMPYLLVIKMRIKILFFVLLFFFIGCSENAPSKEKYVGNTPPDWLLNPVKYSEGKKVAVGCADVHYEGFFAQKKLAIQRAIDELAMQVNTTVSNATYRNKEISGRFKQTFMKSKSIQLVNKVDIKSTILKEYKYPNGRYCVLIVKN